MNSSDANVLETIYPITVDEIGHGFVVGVRKTVTKVSGGDTRSMGTAQL
jgi:hypothetical protein